MATLTQVRPKMMGQRPKSVSIVPDCIVEPVYIEDETAEYPQEFFEHLDKVFAEAKEQIASGELKPVTDVELQRMLDL